MSGSTCCVKDDRVGFRDLPLLTITIDFSIESPVYNLIYVDVHGNLPTCGSYLGENCLQWQLSIITCVKQWWKLSILRHSSKLTL